MRTKADRARAWGKLKRAGSGKQKETRPKEHTFPMSPASDDSNFPPLSHPPSFALNSLWLFRGASCSPPPVTVIMAMTCLMQRVHSGLPFPLNTLSGIIVSVTFTSYYCQCFRSFCVKRYMKQSLFLQKLLSRGSEWL